MIADSVVSAFAAPAGPALESERTEELKAEKSGEESLFG